MSGNIGKVVTCLEKFVKILATTKRLKFRKHVDIKKV